MCPTHICSTATYTSGHIAEFSSAEPWLPESGTISVTFTLHMNVPADDYEVLLQIGDQYLSGADYNVLLLNKGVPEADTRLNSLRHTISVSHVIQWLYSNYVYQTLHSPCPAIVSK